MKLPNTKKYRIVLIQSIRAKTEDTYELYVSNEFSTTKEAFEQLHITLNPLLACGSVSLTRDFLKAIVVPRPVHPQEMGLRLIELMEKDPSVHTDWLCVMQAFVNNCSLGPPVDKGTGNGSGKDPIMALKEKILSFPVKETLATVKIDSLLESTAFPPTSNSVMPEVAGELNCSGDDEMSNQVWTQFQSGQLKSYNSQAEDKSKTWLMYVVEKQYLKSSLKLVLSRANNTNDQHPLTGDTALHIAVRLGNVTLVKLLLAYKADPTIANFDAETPLDAAKKLSGKRSNEIINAIESIQNLRSRVRSYKQQNNHFPKAQKGSDVFLLSLDGGGMRAVIMCHILAAIETRMHELSKSKESLQSYFDYVCGTSAGAVVGALLMYTSNNVQYAGLYLYKFMTDVFGHPKAERTDRLKGFIIDIVGEDTVMSDSKNGRMIITSTVANISPNKLHLMTSYGDARDSQVGPKERKVWQALLASSAAPTYFPAFEHFLDGGLMANNPTLPAMADIFKQAKKDGEKVKIGCVLSLGTGYLYPPNPVENFEVFVPGFTLNIGKSLFHSSRGLFSLLTHFVEQTTQSDGEVVCNAGAWCDSIGAEYFRFSPPLHQEVAPDMHSAEELVSLLFTTELYILEQYSRIDKIAKTILCK